MKDAFMGKNISFATRLHDLRICAYNKRGIREGEEVEEMPFL